MSKSVGSEKLTFSHVKVGPGPSLSGAYETGEVCPCSVAKTLKINTGMKTTTMSKRMSSLSNTGQPLAELVNGPIGNHLLACCDTPTVGSSATRKVVNAGGETVNVGPDGRVAVSAARLA